LLDFVITSSNHRERSSHWEREKSDKENIRETINPEVSIFMTPIEDLLSWEGYEEENMGKGIFTGIIGTSKGLGKERLRKNLKIRKRETPQELSASRDTTERHGNKDSLRKKVGKLPARVLRRTDPLVTGRVRRKKGRPSRTET